MSRHRTSYPPEFRAQIIDLVRAGRCPEELATDIARIEIGRRNLGKTRLLG